MKQLYLLVGLSLFFFWFTPKKTIDSTSDAAYSKSVKPAPRKLNVSVRNKNYIEKNHLSISSDQNWQSPLAANVTAVKSVTVQGGGNAILGGQLNYSIEVSNTASGSANNATGVVFTDILNSNLTLVPGSLKVTPILVEDSYECIGNVGITVPANLGLLANDVSPTNSAMTVTANNTAGTQGTVLTNPDGSFTFTPNVGYSGTTTFTYTASNGDFARTATVSIVVSTPIWFVNSAAASNGNGTLASPFKDWSNFATANALTGATDPAINQTVFVYSGTYSGAVTLKTGQKVLGQGATTSLASFSGSTVQTYTNALPSTSGTRPNLTSIGTTITLGSNNTLQGFDMGNSTKDIVGSSFGTLTASESTLNGNGQALDLSTGALSATFTSISSTNSADYGIYLLSVSGTLTSSGGTTITNPTSRGIAVFSNSSITANFGNTSITGSGNTGLATSGATSNTSALTFVDLDIAPDAGVDAINAIQRGSITCASGTITTTNMNTGSVPAVFIRGADATNKVTLNMVLDSYSSTGVGSQIGLGITDTNGSFTINGTGTTAGSGGTISSFTNRGIDLVNVSNVTLKNMNLTNTNTANLVAGASLDANNYSLSNGGIVASNVTGLTLNNLNINGSVQRGISGHNVSNFSMTNCTVNNSGDEAREGAIAFTNLSGTCSITGSTITRANEHLINIFNTSVNLNLTISNSNITDTQTTSAGTASAIVGTGILANTFGSGKTYITVSNCTLNKIGADAIKMINNDSSTGSYEITGCSIDPVNAVTSPNDVGTAIEITSNETSTVYTYINGNTKLSANGGNVVTIAPTEQSTIHARFTNNTVTYKSGGISGLFRGIEVFGQDDARGYATISGNNISGLPESNGIMVDNRSTLPTHIGNGRIDAIITGNTVNLNYPNPLSTGRTIFLEAGNVSTSKNIVCAKVASNTTSTNGVNGHFRLSSNGTNSAVMLEGTTDASNAWNSNSNTPTTSSGGIVSVRSGSVVTMVAANTCISPLTPPAFASVLADNNQFAEVQNSENRIVYENFEGKKDNIVKSEFLSTVDFTPTNSEVIKTIIEEESQNSITETFAGETVTVAGSGSGFTLPAGKSTTITFSATISNSPTSCAITNTASVSGSNFSTVNSNTTTTNIVIPPPTAVTPNSATSICTGTPVNLSATCASGTVNWYALANPTTLLGNSASGANFSQSPIGNTTYQATCLVGGCESTRVNSSLITVNPNNTISLTSAVGTNAQTLCINTPITNITYATTGATGATFSGLPAGVTGTWASNVVTISGSPTTTTGSPFNYTVTLTGGCGTVTATGTITVSPVNTVSLTSAVGTNAQTLCINTPITNITYATTGATGATFSGLPAGVTGVWVGNVVTISGSPTTTTGSPFNYTVTLTGGCGSVAATGTITVSPANTIALTSAVGTDAQAKCINTAITNITYATTGATGATFSGLPTGVTGVWAGNVITISGTPTTATGSPFNYTVTLTGGCGTVTANGSITVNSTPAPTSPTATPSNFTTSGTTTLTASGCSSPSTISWYDSSNPLVALPNNTPTISSNKTYFARCTGTNTCVSEPSANVNVTYNPCTPLGSSPGNVNITWTGLLSTDWNTACNWNPAWVPDLTNGKVIIPNTVNKPVVSSSDPDIKSIEIQSTALLTINSGRTLNIRGDGGVSKGFTIAGGTVTNNGTINIESETNTAIPAYIYLQATDAVLTNNGTIKINSTDEAIGVGSVSTPATITNSLNGIINIVGGIGVEMALPTDVVNFSNAGTINYDGTVLAFKFLGTTNFTNTGTVNINSGTGIENPTGNTINNNACGKILMASGTYTNGGTTTNTGLIQMPNTYSFTNTGTFTNNGILKANAVSGITNNKVVITNSCPIFTLGGTNNYTVSGIFTDAGATTSAGSYASVGNKFTANNIIPTGIQTLYAQVTNGTCTFVVPFNFDNIKPTSVTINTTNTCAGSSIMLSAACASGTVTWYGTASGPAPLGTGATLSYIPSTGTAQSYYAACETTNCNSGRTITSNSVNVNPKPEPPTLAPPSTLVVCSPSTLTFTASGCVGGTITWSEGAITGSSLILSTVGTYSVSATCTINGCTSNASTLVTGLEIKAKPAAPVITAPTSLSVCFPSTLTITASGCATGTITWSEGASQGSSLVISSVGSYNVSASCTINGCTSDMSNTITNLEIKNKPSIPTAVSVNNSIICLNSTITLSANCSQGSNNIFSSLDDGTISKTNNGNKDTQTFQNTPSQIIWYNQASGGVSVGSGSNLVLSPTSNTTYYAACSADGCESDRVPTSEVQVVTSFASPTAVSVSKTSICNSGTVTLTATCQTGTVTWYTSMNGGTSVGTGSPFDQSVNQNVTYYAACEGGNCVSARVATMAIVVSKTTIACNLPIATNATSNCGAVVTYSAPVVQSCNIAGLQTQTYNYTGSVVDWVVPSGVTSINIKAWGAQGGANWINNTNFGGYSEGTLSVTPGEVLKINVGGQPTTTAGGWNGGGNGEGMGKGGGGASDVRQGGSLLTNRKLVASGGGGAGYWSNLHIVGGEGGGLTGGNGYRFPDFGTNPGGKGATQTAGGADGTCVNFNVIAMAGSLGQGGSPFNCGCEGYGGGGGYYGGAGSGNCRGGGGGSGYIGGVTSGNMQAGVQSGHGKIEISYQGVSAPTVTQTSGLASGSTFPVGTTTNTFEVNDNGYITSCSFDVTVNEVLTTITYNGTEFCGTTSASSLPVTITGISGGNFSSSPSGLSLNGTTGAIDLMTSIPGTYSISYSLVGCNIPSTTSIEIKAKPTAPIITPPSTLVVCSPSTLTLTASGCAGGTITWSEGAAIGTSLVLSAVGTYSVSATCTINGCTSDASTVITGLEIKAKPLAPTIMPPASLSICSPSTLTLTASGCVGGTITWSEGAATGTSLVLSTIGTYNVSATCTINGCTSEASTIITGLEIKAKPSAPTVTAPVEKVVCSPSTLTLTASNCAGTVTWSEGGATGTSLTLNAVGTYSISATCTVNGCTSEASTIITGLEIKAKPSAPTVTAPVEKVVCSPSTLTLTASNCAGTVTWSEGGATGASLTLNSVGTYSISATCTVNGCISEASTIITGLEIKAKPSAPTVTAPVEKVVCSPSTLTLTASNCAGTVTWSEGGATGTSLTLNAVGTYSISATCTVNGCTSEASTIITGLEVKALPVSSATSNSPICAGGSLNLIGSEGETYLWSGPNSYSSTDRNPIISNAGISSAGTYTLTVTSKGCSSSAQTVVAINTISIPAPTGTANLSCDVLSVTRTASGGQSYVWSGGLGTNPMATITTAGTYTVTVTDANGCSATASTVVTFTNNLQITQHPQNVSICQGNNATFTVQANLPGVTYQWEVNSGSGFSPISASAVYSGQNSATLSLAFPALAYNNYKYRCIITLNSCNSTSNEATLSLAGSAEALNIINISPISGVYSQTAVAYTIALNKIEPNANVTYKSGNAIELLPGFETRGGAVFQTKIESPCGNNSGFTTNFENLPKEIRK
ncbi:MAG TPA: glycine-rich protein [Leadbetterella sp.]|nr:glycine-rich protein [Leadbetterella sp.]